MDQLQWFRVHCAEPCKSDKITWNSIHFHCKKLKWIHSGSQWAMPTQSNRIQSANCQIVDITFSGGVCLCYIQHKTSHAHYNNAHRSRNTQNLIIFHEEEDNVPMEWKKQREKKVHTRNERSIFGICVTFVWLVQVINAVNKLCILDVCESLFGDRIWWKYLWKLKPHKRKRMKNEHRNSVCLVQGITSYISFIIELGVGCGSSNTDIYTDSTLHCYLSTKIITSNSIKIRVFFCTIQFRKISYSKIDNFFYW